MPHNARSENFRTLTFTILLCGICAFILATLASSLKSRQEEAIKLDRYRQMLMSAQILSKEGYFLTLDKDLKRVRAQMDSSGHLTPNTQPAEASKQQITDLFGRAITPMLVDTQGQLQTFVQAGIDYENYFTQNQKLGFSQLPLKLIYTIKLKKDSPHYDGFIIPINGFGLWGPIYGYIALERDGNTILGISWYQHGETPGLGANISTAEWQSQFSGKKIFQVDKSGKMDPEKTPLGIVVIKGKVQDVYGSDPRSVNSVDGMSGATITGNGVTSAYKDVLEEYRPFLIEQFRKK